MLRDELQDGRISTEQLVINASINSLPGSTREVANVKILFSCFGFIPEDTAVDLPTVHLIFAAVKAHVDDLDADLTQNVTLMHIRKWVQVLQGRSLVLGHIDKPVRARPGRSTALSVFHSESVLYRAFCMG